MSGITLPGTVHFRRTGCGNDSASSWSIWASGTGWDRPRPELAEGCRSYPFGKYCFYFRPHPDGIELLRSALRQGLRMSSNGNHGLYNSRGLLQAWDAGFS